MKYHIRKVEKDTIWLATEAVELDPKFFKKLKTNPYTGSSEKDFIIYIRGLLHSEVPQELEDIDYETYQKLIDFEDMEKTVYNSTSQHSEESWLEIGKVDPSYSKSGGFKMSHSV